jgi:hypothetical protein
MAGKKKETPKAKDVKEQDALQQIFDDKRYFTYQDSKYYVDNADLVSVRQADWHYSKTYSEALLAGVPTAAQMQDILEERKIIKQDYEEVRVDIMRQIEEKAAEIRAMSAKADREAFLAVTKELEELRGQLLKHNQRASSPMSNTCEQLADDSRMAYLTSAMVKDDAGKRVWESYDEYMSADTNAELAMFARYHCMLFLQGLDPDFMEKTPEAVARKELLALDEGESTKQITAEPETAE